MSIHRSHRPPRGGTWQCLGRAPRARLSLPLLVPLLVVGAGMGSGCAARSQSRTAAETSPSPGTGPSAAAAGVPSQPNRTGNSYAPLGPPQSATEGIRRPRPGETRRQDEGDDQDDVELVVSREIVGSCPTLRVVREHVGEFDPDLVWLAVLESIADCMSQDAPLARQTIGVTGDEEHRHVVREVLGSRGIAPTRVVARSVSLGAAECQGGTGCNKRVEITIVP